MLHRAGNLKISRKMIAVFLAICFVSISVSAICVSYAAMKSIDRRTEVLAQAVNAQAAAGLEHFVQSCRGLMMAVLVDSDVLNTLSRGTVPVSEQAEYRAQVNKLLFRLIKMQPLLTHAGIALQGGRYFQTGAAGENTDMAAMMNEEWMRRTVEGEETFTLIPMHDGGYTNRHQHGPVISAVQKLYGPFRQPAGVIVLDVESDAILQLGGEDLLQENMQGIRLAVEDDAHRMLYDSAGEEGPSLRNGEGFRLFEMPDQRYLVQTTVLEDLGVSVHTIYPKATLALLRRDLILVTALSVYVCVLLSGACAVFFSRSFTRPIARLREAMAQVDNGRYPRVRGEAGQDEFGDLIRQYNQMVERIERLIDQVYQKDLQKKDAQLLALQTQINPHMMFNTLESIRMKALVAGNRDVAEMTSLLGKMFRMTLENVNQRHTVRNELDYVRSFLRLQNLRFRAENTLTAEMPEELMEVPCPVILFQPLVENSLSHGAAGADVPLHIRIRGWREPETGRILFRITDDGTGMEPDRLMQISDRLESIRREEIRMTAPEEGERQHIGLENIAKRLQLRYGPESYMKVIYSNETGTEIEICIVEAADAEQPRRREENGDPNPDCGR
ncbi:MAG: sensor histidine kinase [Clostridia bacterium]|nr:sensor histidine kinase [Clostridia bacterium]